MDALTAADGIALAWCEWPALGDAPRGTVLIVHGLGEHARRHEPTALRLAADGWRVVGYDQRGHGASGGARGALPAPDRLLDDLGHVIDAVSAGCRSPLVLLGHSMGGTVAARFAAEGLAQTPAPWWRPIDALVLSSPALDPGLSAPQKLLLMLLGPLAPNLALGNGLDVRWISRDAAVVDAYRCDPLVHDRITPRLARFIVDAGAAVLAAAPRWTLPTLLLYAGADRCVAPRASAAFAAAAPVQAQRFESLYHEIFNEPEREQVWQLATQWLAERFAPRGVAAAEAGQR